MLTYLNRIALGVAGAAIFVMAIIGGADVIGSNLFSHPAPAAYELTELLMVPAVILTLASLQARRLNIAVDIVVARVPEAMRAWCELFALVLGLGLFGLITWQGWLLAVDSLYVREYAQGAYRIPVYPFKLAFAVGVTLATLQYAQDLFATIRNRARGSERPG